MFGRGYRYRRFQRMPVTSGYRYVGPCRCGTGPNAFYQGHRDQLLHAWDILSKPSYSQENLQDELEELKGEKMEIEKQIEQIEKLITNQGKKE